MIEWERVQIILGVLDRIRPVLQSDGVDVELLEVQANNASIRLTGLCSSCASARLTMQAGFEEMLRQGIKDFGELRLVYDKPSA